jgi:membrane-associated phospholipid phosphatase
MSSFSSRRSAASRWASWIAPLRMSQVLVAVGAALALAGCADQATAPDASSSRPSGGAPLASAVKFWEAGSSVAWNATGRELILGRPFNPFFELRVLTYLSLAQYDAIIAAENSTTPGTHPSRAGASAGASVVVLKSFFSSPAETDLIDARLAAQAAGPTWSGEEHQDFAAGEAVGRAVGDGVVAYAQSDNTGVLPPPPQPSGPGYWTSTAPVLGLFGTRPLALKSADQFRPAAPPAFGSVAFLTDLAEIRLLSDTRTPAQLAQAQFWAARVARYQNEIAANLIVSHHRSERDAAHIFALANTAAFDATIGCWDAKFTYWYIRPSQADPLITLPIGLPNHPSFPSGHSCVTAAYSEVLGDAFPDERPSLAANVEAAGLSRMYAGLHYRFDIVAGQVLGRQVADYVLATDVTGHNPIPLD